MYKKIIISTAIIFMFSLNFIYAQTYSKKTYTHERLAVLNFDGRVDRKVKETVTNKIEAELASLKRFQVVNRRTIESASKELALNLTGLIDETSILRVGKYLSAQKLILGNINYCNTKWDGDSKVHTTEISISAIIVEVERNLSKEGIDLTTSASDKDRRTSINSAIDNAVSQFIIKIREIYALDAHIFNIENGDVYIDIGSKDGLKAGTIFDVIELGKKIRNPRTGEVYGQREENIGRIKIVEVYPKYSKARIISGIYRIKIDNIIRERPGMILPSGYILFSFSLIPVNSEKNINFSSPLISQAKYFGINYVWERLDSPTAIEMQLGYISMNEVDCFAGDLTAKYVIRLIPESLNAYLGGGIGFITAYQDLPNAANVISELNLDSDDTHVDDSAFGYLFSFSLRLSGLKYFQPFAEFGWRHYNSLDEWTVDHKTGKDDDSEAKEIPKIYLPYPSIITEGFTFRFGLVLIF